MPKPSMFFLALIDFRGRGEYLVNNNAWSIKFLKYQWGLAAAIMVNRLTMSGRQT